MAPAVIALMLYSLLPVVRSTVAGLDQVPRPVVEAATGMGLTRGQVFGKVELPIALPVFLSGVRIAAVQAVGLAVVAALIGAGGLGALVFQGLASGALDLVLLGVIPVVALAVVVDAAFRLLSSSSGHACRMITFEHVGKAFAGVRGHRRPFADDRRGRVRRRDRPFRFGQVHDAQDAEPPGRARTRTHRVCR